MPFPRRRLAGGLAVAAALISAAPADAGVPHTVQPGETLWSIAAANNFTTRSLAAANGLSESSNVVPSGSTWPCSTSASPGAAFPPGRWTALAADGVAGPHDPGAARTDPLLPRIPWREWRTPRSATASAAQPLLTIE